MVSSWQEILTQKELQCSSFEPSSTMPNPIASDRFLLNTVAYTHIPMCMCVYR